MTIEYKVNHTITADQFIDLLIRSTLAERRPIDDRPCIESMLANANLIVTAWDGDTLVGVARSVTDFVYCCYLSDLAVDQAYQRQGIGDTLCKTTRQQLGEHGKVVLIAAPAAYEYYAKIGLKHNDHCWVLR
jgi:GNAT superfamily N-acetyltransferase